MRRLLAVDAGLRAGLALWDDTGTLHWYRSRNYGARARLKRAAWRAVGEAGPLDALVVEGGGPMADPWLRAADRRDVPARSVDAGAWRERLLLPRDRRSGGDAKDEAVRLARTVIEWAGAPRPTSLRHDAAEAVLVGLWALVDQGWLPLPEPFRL